MLLALVLALGITCPSSAFALDEAGTDALSGASVAQEQTDTVQGTKAASNDTLEEAEVPSGSAVEPNLDTAIESEKNRPEETTGAVAGQEPAAEQPALTGYVFISGNTKVGATLSATVEGTPRSATLSYQWYRGDSPISGAISTIYTTTNADDDCDISCRVTAAGYEGILISGSIKPALPVLTGSVVIVNVSSPDGIEVGDTLAATVNGVQADALLHCQWYRGDTAIEGATSTNYVLVNTDVGQSITCKVTAENYRGVLVSNVLIPSDQLVTVEYWSYTDASQNDMVIVHTEVVNLADRFNYRFDQNKDDDPSNDYVGYRCSGWMDEWGLEFYDITAQPSEYTTTLGDIANMLEWDGVSPLRMYAYMDLRYIEVTYHTNGYADEYHMETVQLIAWTEAPYQDIHWPGYELLGIMDEYCNYIDETMTCGDILQGLAEISFVDPADIREYLHSVETLDLYFDWNYRQYKVYFISPGSTYVQSCGYYEDLVLAVPEAIDGYEFAGWFTEPDGAGIQVHNGMKYCNVEPNDQVEKVTLYAHFTPKTYRLTIDLGAGKWIDDANETRPNAFPSFSGQHSGVFECSGDSVIELPIDVRYGGLVQAPVDSQGRPYVLVGFAFENGSILCVTYPDGTQKNLEGQEVIVKAKQLDGLNNYSYYRAFEDASTFVVADATKSAFTTWSEDMTLHAVWILWGISPTFDPRGYADFNDPEKGAKYRPCYEVHLNPDGSIDESRTTATASGFWNTPDRMVPSGYEGGVTQLDPSITLPSGNMLIRPGFIFAGWSTKLGATEPDADLAYTDRDRDGIPDPPTTWVMFTENTTLYAVWNTVEVEVIYDVNDPNVDAIPSDAWFTDCQMVLTERIPVKKGYVFLGWAVVPDATHIDYQPGDLYGVIPPILAKRIDDEGNTYYKEVNPNVLYAVWQREPVEVQYWSFTDDSLDDYVLVRSVMCQRTDLFDCDYDQNKDDDPSNDCVAFYTLGWWDWEFSEYYERRTSTGGTFVTVEELAEAAGWDGVSPIKVYTELSIRMIKVVFDYGGYEKDHTVDSERYSYWDEVPYNRSIYWQAHGFLGFFDHLGREIEGEKTCEEILSEHVGDKWADSIFISCKWEKISYTVRFVNQYTGESSYTLEYTEVVDLSRGDATPPQSGYEFVGWFTEPDGQGQKVEAGTKYCAVIGDDKVESMTLYAYFRPIEGVA